MFTSKEYTTCIEAADIRITGYAKGSCQDFEHGLASFFMALLNGLITIDLQVMIRILSAVDLNPYLDDFPLAF